MKKAKEYAADVIRMIEGREEDKLWEIMQELLGEIITLTKERNVKSNSAMKAILKQQDDKWRAICNKVNSHFGEEALKREGFMELMRTKFPDTDKIMESN